MRPIPSTLTTRAVATAALLGSLLLSACGRDGGPTDPVGESRNTSAAVAPGLITIWTSDPSPSPIQVFIDGTSVGVLMAYRYAAPGCGQPTNSTAGVITVSVSAGSHTVSAAETRGNGYWSPMSVQVLSGGCYPIVLDP